VSGFGPAGPPPAPEINGWKHLRTGKVRDLYTNDKNQILLVASDRISAYDWVMPTVIPGKGEYLPSYHFFGLNFWKTLLAIT
jgi:phosphoribosylaminoimidazole-succinocarboxamide synthase